MRSRPFRPRQVGVVGDSCTGLLAALALKEWRPELEVTLCGPARALPPGESHVTPAVVAFLHGYLGLDIHRFHAAVEPSWRLGSTVAGPDGGPISWPYEQGDLGDAWAHDGDLIRTGIAAMLMAAGKTPIIEIGGQLHTLVPQMPVGYDFDEPRLRSFLETRATAVRVIRQSQPIATVEADETGVTGILFADGKRLVADLWIDATGDASLLLGEALAVPRAVEHSLPASTRTRDAPDVATPIRSGVAHRRASAVSHNVMALGASYCALGANGPGALTIAVRHLTRLLGLMMSSTPSPDLVNTELAAHWDDEWAVLQAIGGRRSAGPPARGTGGVFAARDVTGPCVAIGLLPAPTPTVSKPDWEELVAMRQQVVDAALAPEAALKAVCADRALLDALTQADRGWLVDAAQRLRQPAPPRGRSPHALASWAATEEIGITLPHAVDPTASFELNPSLDYGKFIRRTPDCILRPKDQAALSRCLRMLRRRQIPFKTRGAGHTAGGQTLIEEGVILDLRWLKRIVGDAPNADRITVEAGMWWLEVAAFLHSQGRCPSTVTMNWRVTVGGTLSVGGFGDRSHDTGLQTRTVLGLRVMTLDGESHQVGPGDPLFDYALAGRGQLAVITEATLATTRRSETLMARVLTWRNARSYLKACGPIGREGRFQLLRTRLEWKTGIVRGAAGNFRDTTLHQDALLHGLDAKAGPMEPFAYFSEHTKPPNAHWLPDCPAVEIVLPCELTAPDAAARLVKQVRTAVLGLGLGPFLPLGSSIMVVPTAGHTPLAPLPGTSHALLLAIRPEIPNGLGAHWADAMVSLAKLAYTLGGKLYLVGIEQPGVIDLDAQYGEALAPFVALKRQHDPMGLMNPGLLSGDHRS
ncbi:MAG: cytokinin dehydrogenase [Myxococcota bacterium]